MCSSDLADPALYFDPPCLRRADERLNLESVGDVGIVARVLYNAAADAVPLPFAADDRKSDPSPGRKIDRDVRYGFPACQRAERGDRGGGRACAG